MVFIAHDLAVVKNVSDRVAVMYLGKLCEVGSPDLLYAQPPIRTPRRCWRRSPSRTPTTSDERASAAAGELPSPVNPPSGCRFRTRCPYAQDRCAAEEPLCARSRPGQPWPATSRSSRASRSRPATCSPSSTCMTFAGEIVGIYVTPAAGQPMEARTRRDARRRGFVGDRYAERTGTYSHDTRVPRDVTLIEREAVEAVNAELRAGGIEIAEAETRRNVVTAGVPLNHLVGRTFRAGAVFSGA